MEKRLEHSGDDSPLRLAATCGELGSIDQDSERLLIAGRLHRHRRTQAGDMRVYTADWLL